MRIRSLDSVALRTELDWRRGSKALREGSDGREVVLSRELCHTSVVTSIAFVLEHSSAESRAIRVFVYKLRTLTNYFRLNLMVLYTLWAVSGLPLRFNYAILRFLTEFGYD